MVRYEIYYISAIFGGTKITSSIIFSKNLEITSHCVEFCEHGKPRKESNIMNMVHFWEKNKVDVVGKRKYKKANST